MNNITPEARDKIQELIKSNHLIDALDILENYDFDFNTILLLKANVNRLKRDKLLLQPNNYNENLQRIKKSIFDLIGLEYQPEEVLPENYNETISSNKTIEKENEI